MRRLFSAISLTVCSSLSGLAHAQEDPRKAQAESLFSEGLKLHDLNRDADALAKYRQSYGVYPTPNILFATARLEQVLGQSVLAITHFREALRSPLLHPRNQELGKGYVAELEKKLARVIVIGPAGLRVTIVGKEHRLPLDAAVDVEPGVVNAHAEANGSRYAGRVETLAGSEAILEMKLVQDASNQGAQRPLGGGAAGASPPPEEGQPTYASRNIVTVALLAAGAVGIGVGTGFVAKSEGEISDASDYRASVPGGPCPVRSAASCERYSALLEDAQASRSVAIGSFVGAGVLVAGAAAVWLFWPTRRSAAWTSPAFFGGATGVRGTF